MTQSSDIKSLFQKFGGDAGSYQEIGRENDSQAARHRWPVLDAIDLSQATTLPAAEPDASRKPRAAITLPALSRFAAPAVAPFVPAHPDVDPDKLRFAGLQEPVPADHAAQSTVAPTIPNQAVSRFGRLPVSGSTHAAPAASTSAAASAAVQPTGVQPDSGAAPAPQTSILRKMFSPPATATPASATPDALPALFARLLDAPQPAAPSTPASANEPGPAWLARGPRRP
jgi:hypothetical protein